MQHVERFEQPARMQRNEHPRPCASRASRAAAVMSAHECGMIQTGDLNRTDWERGLPSATERLNIVAQRCATQPLEECVNDTWASVRDRARKIGLLSCLIAALPSCGAADETLIGTPGDDEDELSTARAVGQLRQGIGLITMIGRVVTTADVGVPGVSVELVGSTPGTAVTDANGMVRFDVPPGEHALRPRKAGARFTPRSAESNGDAAEFITFDCTGSCNASTPVSVEKSLLITDPSVLADPRASNASGGPWSFRFMLEQMAPPEADAADFARAWLDEFSVPQLMNGFPLERRDLSSLLALWPTTAEGKLDLARAPFRLLAIVNRTDLHASANGELRFVYGVVDADGFGQLMSVIFEFALPERDATSGAGSTRLSWIEQFHALGGVDFGGDYNAGLQTLTDRVTRRGSSPSRPGGSAISQVRSNEIMMGPEWQMREFHLSDEGQAPRLRLAPTAMTPDDSHAVLESPENDAIADYINDNAVLIRGGFATVPAIRIGGQATESFPWAFSKPVDERARRSFAGQTCNGCHAVETAGLQLDGFYHISPTSEGGPDGTDRVSQFIKQIEIPRRRAFMQNQLSCTGVDCAAGSEPIFF